MIQGPVLIVALVAACGAPHFARELETTEHPPGTCATLVLEAGEKCEAGARDHGAGGGAVIPYGHPDEPGGSLWFRIPYFQVLLDARSVRKVNDPESHDTLAGGVGTQLRPLMLWPRAFRHVDVTAGGGMDLGVINVRSKVEGRFDGFVGAAIAVYAPDFGPFRYLDRGVPGLQVGVRRTWYVQGWSPETTFELGLIWRWGTPIDIATQWTTVYKNHD